MVGHKTPGDDRVPVVTHQVRDELRWIGREAVERRLIFEVANPAAVPATIASPRKE